MTLHGLSTGEVVGVRKGSTAPCLWVSGAHVHDPGLRMLSRYICSQNIIRAVLVSIVGSLRGELHYLLEIRLIFGSL